MSRIGKQPIEVPATAKVTIDGRMVTVEGPKGTLRFEHHELVRVVWDESEKSIICTIDEADLDTRSVRAQWGTTRAILANMVAGVVKGYERKLEVIGVGWNVSLAGQTLKLNVGYANTVEVAIPAGVAVAVNKQMMTVSGADKQAVGQLAAEIRAVRKPEPYNGKGIKYLDETIRRKQGKQFGS